jgi:Spy/CpxP family protein refolding chaperone
MFRRLVIVSSLAVALAGTAALAQGVRGPRAHNRGARGGLGLQGLQQKLNLTDVQMNAVRALQETRRSETQSLQQEMRQKRQTLRQLLQETNPNPSDVGNATLALKESRTRTREINQRFVASLKGLLTPQQLQQLPKRLQ